MYWPHDPNQPVAKVCARCGEEKPFPEFYLRYGVGRRVSWCRVCERARMRRYNDANREKRRAADRRRYAEHVEERRAAGRRHYAENREKARAAGQES